MRSDSITKVARLAGTLSLAVVFATLGSGQSKPAPNRTEHEEGIPVTDPLVIAKCATCHERDDRGNMERISWERTTPEGWQDALKQMIVLQGVSVTAVEARSIVKSLSTSHGLAPEENEPVTYEAERRIQDETGMGTETFRNACSKCHSLARTLSWRRSTGDWKQFVDSHAARYKIRQVQEVVTFLASAAPLHTTAWDTWRSRPVMGSLGGRWLVTASMPGHGVYYGEAYLDQDGDGEYNTRVTLTSVRDGSRVARSGRTIVFGGYAWRGSSRAAGLAGSTPDDPSSEGREVLSLSRDKSSAQGRWFWGQYYEFGIDVKLQRPSSGPTLTTLDLTSLKIGSQANRIRVIGDNFPTQITLTDLDFGPGVSVRRILSQSATEIVAELDVAQNTPLGKHTVAFRESKLSDAITIYDRIDYIKLVPDSTVAAFGDHTHPKGYQQFEAVAYQRGPDGRTHTADDVALGPVDVTWTLQVFHATETGSSISVGTISPTGLFTPADKISNTNFDVWVIATAKDEKDVDGAPLVGKSYMVVTVPIYIFNGRQYVRELGRWVDDGPARGQ